MITAYRVALLAIILFFPLTCLLIGEASVNAQEEALGLGEHNFQVSQTQWKKFEIACNNCLWRVEPSNPVRVRFDDGGEFQKLPSAKNFSLPNGSVINTDVLKIVGKKHIPVEGFGRMPSPFFYLRAESRTVNIHVIIKQNDSSAASQQDGEKPILIKIGKGIIDFIPEGIMKGVMSFLVSCCCLVFFIYALSQIGR